MKRYAMISGLIGLYAAGTAVAEVDVVDDGGMTYTAIQLHGSTSQKYDIVFIGDGFTAAQQDDFNDAVDDAVAAMEARVPFSQRMCALNIWRVNVLSVQSGVDHPADGTFVNSELDCRYGNPAWGEAERCITSDSPEKCVEAAAHAPAADAVFVLVNDTQWGGFAGNLVFSSISSGFAGIITHELGHKIGGLADEYQCYICDGSDSGSTYTGAEPWQVNATKQTNPALIKWKDLIEEGTPIPTTVDSPVGVVGLWQGALYKALGVYRPQSTCHMRASGQPFCAVCERHMRSELSDHCTACEIDPSSFLCLYGDLLDEFDLYWTEEVIIKWPIPPCLTCPFRFRDDDYILPYDEMHYTLEGLPEGFLVRVVGKEGDIIAEGSAQGGLVMLSFETKALEQASIEVQSIGTPSGEMLGLQSQLFVNGQEQALP